MSDEVQFTEDQKLQLCNLASQGMPLADAKKQVLSGSRSNQPQAPEGGPKKQSVKEKKAALAAEIESLGGEVPASNVSVAKFEEALTAAKAAKSEEEDGDLM